MTSQSLHHRPYQTEAVDAVFKAWSEGMQRPAVVLPTGSGKTCVFSFLAQRFVRENQQRVIVLVHRDEICDQAIDKIRTVCPELNVGKVKAGNNDVHAQVIVASIQTLSRERRLNQLLATQEFAGRIGLVICDEAHHSSARTWVDVMKALGCYDPASGTRTLGVTATLARGDGQGLGDVWQDVVYSKSVLWMISKGYLVDVKGQAIESSMDLGSVKKSGGDFQAKALGEELLASGGPELIAKAMQQYAPGRRSIVFTPDVASAHATKDALDAALVPSAVISGATPRDERLDAFQKFRSGQYQALVNCMVLCLDEETEILTDHGWTSYRDMTMNHQVANWDQGQVFFKEPYEVVVRDRGPQEDMYVLETTRRSIRVTGRHRMLYRTSDNGPFLKAPVDDIAGRKVRIPTCGTAEPERPSNLTLDECRLIGFWTGDGSINRPGGGVEYTMSQALTYPKIIEWVDGVLERTGLDFRRYDRSHYAVPHVRWSLPRGTGSGLQKRNGVKHFEEFLAKDGSDRLGDLNAEQFAAFLEGLWHADGNHGQATDGLPGSFCVYKSNMEMLERVQAVASVRGWTCSLRQETAPRKDDHRQVYRLSFHRRTEHRMGGTDPQYRIQKETALWRPEKVWCVRTETRNIITRRHGSVTVMGNTEGFDSPWADCAVIARPTQSAPLYIQMVGRVLRPYGQDKKDALVLDITGTGGRISTLIDLAPGEVRSIRNSESLAEAYVRSEKEANARIPARSLAFSLKHREMDMFAGSEHAWLRTVAGVLFLGGVGESGKDDILIWPSAQPGRWDVVLAPARGSWEKVKTDLELGMAQAWGETVADDLMAFNKTKAASWRKAKPSPQQKDFARSLRLEFSEDIRKGPLSDLISIKLTSRKVDRYVPREEAR